MASSDLMGVSCLQHNHDRCSSRGMLHFEQIAIRATCISELLALMVTCPLRLLFIPAAILEFRRMDNWDCKLAIRPQSPLHFIKDKPNLDWSCSIGKSLLLKRTSKLAPYTVSPPDLTAPAAPTKAKRFATAIWSSILSPVGYIFTQQSNGYPSWCFVHLKNCLFWFHFSGCAQAAFQHSECRILPWLIHSLHTLHRLKNLLWFELQMRLEPNWWGHWTGNIGYVRVSL